MVTFNLTFYSNSAIIPGKDNTITKHYSCDIQIICNNWCSNLIFTDLQIFPYIPINHYIIVSLFIFILAVKIV